MAIKTQGTELFFRDPDTDAVVEVGCVTSITGLNFPSDQIETTCLDSLARTYVAGMPTPGTMTFSINADPGADASHARLMELNVTRPDMQWVIGWGDGTADPTGVDTSGFVLPTTRTWTEFNGFIQDLPLEFALNAVVTSAVAVQISGPAVTTAKST